MNQEPSHNLRDHQITISGHRFPCGDTAQIVECSCRAIGLMEQYNGGCGISHVAAALGSVPVPPLDTFHRSLVGYLDGSVISPTEVRIRAEHIARS